MRSRVLPVVVAAALLAVLGVDLRTAADLRGDQRRARAAAVEAERVQAYRDQVRPLIEQVYDEVQPLQEAVDFYLQPSPDAEQIRQDVFARSGARAALAKLRAQLGAVREPASLRQHTRNLDEAVGQLVDAAQRLERNAGPADPLGQQRAAETILGGAIGSWYQAVSGVYEAKSLPTLPYGGTPPPGVRRPQSHGSWIRAADNVCSASIDSGLALPDLSTPRDIVAAGPRHAKLIRSTLAGLQALPTPLADKDRVARALVPSLRATLRMADGLDALAAAARTGNAAAIQRGLTTLTQGLRASRQLSVELNKSGVTVCRDIFAVPAGEIPGESPTAPLDA